MKFDINEVFLKKIADSGNEYDYVIIDIETGNMIVLEDDEEYRETIQDLFKLGVRIEPIIG